MSVNCSKKAENQIVQVPFKLLHRRDSCSADDSTEQRQCVWADHKVISKYRTEAMKY